MISLTKTRRLSTLCASLLAITACGGDPAARDAENAIIDDEPGECSPDRPDCWVSEDFPIEGELDASNSAGLRFSDDTRTLVVDRVSSLPDIDGDGVPDDADDCPGMPDWISCDNDPSNDGLYATVFHDPAGASEVTRTEVALTTADIPRIDVYFLIDATPTLAEEITELQTNILTIIDDIRLDFPDAHFGLGLYREYPLDPLAAPYSQAPYHHILDLTDDELLVQVAVSTLNTVKNNTPPSATAATQAMYSVASGLGLGDMVPNRGSCPNAPDADIGYPCFRADALHVVMNITDAEVHNGPDALGAQYGDPPFGPGVGVGVMDVPPVEMFPALFTAADSGAMPLDLGDLSGQSLTLMGMSTLLTDQVDTDLAPGCVPTPPVPPDTGLDTNAKDAVLALRFDSPVAGVSAFAINTHWPGANVALFDDVLLDPTMALACDGGAGVQRWGSVAWAPATSQQYYLVADGIVPAVPMQEPEGAFSISIVHDGDPPNPTWLTSDAPVVWTDIETALLASDIRVASVVTLRDAMDISSPGNPDARLIAAATDALTKTNGQWVTELPSASGDGLDSAISNTIGLAATDSVYDISMVDVDNDATPIDERDFVVQIRRQDCAQGDAFECATGFANRCLSCELGALLEYEVLFRNSSVAPTGVSQVFDFEVVSWADDSVEVERIPVRVMVPDAAAHAFDDSFESNFYRNVYNGAESCDMQTFPTPPERPKWGDLTWEGSTPTGTSIEFQIRTAATEAELLLAVPAVISIPADTEESTLNITEELIADGLPYGLPYIQITALLNPSNSPPATPTLKGWSFEFVCEAAE